jgi:hypothetical protein
MTSRRSLLATAAAVGSSLLFGGCAQQPRRADAASCNQKWREALLTYLQSLARPDGGYAFADQDRSHLTSTCAVIGCYHLLKEPVPNSKTLAAFVRDNHPSRLKKLEQERRAFEFQQVQALIWLGDDAPDFRQRILAWKQPLAYMKQYERHGYPVFSSEISGAFICRQLLKLPLADLAPTFTDYLDSRRRENGSFNNTPAANGGDGHVINTMWGLRALHALGHADEKRQQVINWLVQCQLRSGGFTWQPNPPFAGVDDIAYSRAALRSLQLLGVRLPHWLDAIGYIFSLMNPDGGFADRQGWLSNPLATYYALDALDAMSALPHYSVEVPRITAAPPALPTGLNIFSAQIEAHGQGSPSEAVTLAAALKIHLWGAKNSQPQWLATAQSIADRRRVPVKFFTSNEEYGTWVDVPGLGTYSHTSDIIARAGADIGASLSGQPAVTWQEFKERRLRQLEKAHGRLIWQFGENEELVRLFLDDALAEPGARKQAGYAAISTFHFGNPDFTNSEPFLNRWRGQIPFIALQDAHGTEPWWFADMTSGFRTLFLATEPTWEGFLEALRNNWTVAVRHDALSNHQTWMHSGDDRVLRFVRRREEDWRWWDNPSIRRPMVSIIAIRPEDRFEVHRPETGLTIRVRCAWENTAQGLLRTPITELVKLTIDDVQVTPVLVSTKAARGNLLADHYHHFHLENLTPGLHFAEALIRNLADNATFHQRIEFEI